MTDVVTERAVADQMRTAATAFLAALTDAQRHIAQGPFDAPDAHEWTYLPGPRPGLALREMSQPQRALALTLLDLGLSASGVSTAHTVMELEATLRELDRAAGADFELRHPLNFWFRVLGDPRGLSNAPWAWKVGGHHLAVHLTVVGDRLAATPQFFGANPARVPRGEREGFRALPDEEDLGRGLFLALDESQQAQALANELAPSDILTRRDPVADLGQIPRGLSWGDMDGGQRARLERLIRVYLDKPTPSVGARAWAEITEAGLAKVSFAWAGTSEVGGPHYYAVLGNSFVLEYDNTQDGANHVHTVWRDVRHDWGTDLLSDHYTAVNHT